MGEGKMMRLRVPREVLMMLLSKMRCNATAEVKASLVHPPVVPPAHHTVVPFLGEQRTVTVEWR